MPCVKTQDKLCDQKTCKCCYNRSLASLLEHSNFICKSKNLNLSKVICENVEKYKKNYTFLCKLCETEFKTTLPFILCPKCKYDKKCVFCSKEFKRNLTRHLWEIHTQNGGKWFECKEKDCVYKCKNKSNLKRHLWDIHEKGNGEWFMCSENDCKYKCKRKSHIKDHLWQVHEIGNGKWFECEEKDCGYKCKSNSSLNTHLCHVHNDEQLFECEEKDCNKKFKSKGNLNQHLSSVHDIGDIQCEHCYTNVFKVNPYINHITKKKEHICRSCYNKSTGYTTSKEKQMVEYVKKDQKIAPYIVLANQIIKGHLCQTLRRPDLLISSTSDLHIVIECDEFQHSNYNLECEFGRMDEIIDELEGRVIFIRWNPDRYKVYNKRGTVSRKEKLKLLNKLILHISNKTDWSDDEQYVAYYMFYDDTKEDIYRKYCRFKIKYIYQETDFCDL